jgi:phage baseplate assembly protein W
MATTVRQKTIGISFPFNESSNGDFLLLTTSPTNEIKSNLQHLLLTRKGARYMLPEFGTNLYQYLFEPLDEITKNKIQDEINTSCEKFLPNLKVNKVNITQKNNGTYDNILSKKVYVSIDYTLTIKTFEYSDNITIEF